MSLIENSSESEIRKEASETTTSTTSEGEIISRDESLSSLTSNKEPVDEQEPITRNGIKVTVDCFGFCKNQQSGQLAAIKRFKITNENLMVVEIITFGATITSIQVPSVFGVSEDILLGYNSLISYFYSKSTPLGAMANFTKSAPNLSKVIWTPHLNETDLTLTHIYDDDLNGQRNSILFTCTFEIKNDNSLTISSTAKSALPCFFNISANLNFNLSGHSAKFIYDQMIALNCDSYVVQDKKWDGNLTDEHVDVKNTAFDLRTAIDFGEAMARNNYTGFDHNFVITKYGQQRLAFVCRVFDPLSGRSLDIYSDQSFVKLKTVTDWGETTTSLSELKDRFHRLVTVEECGDAIADKPVDLDEINTSVVECFGKNGAKYTKHGAFSLRLLRFPYFESCGHPSNLDINYSHTTIYKFGISGNNLSDNLSDNMQF